MSAAPTRQARSQSAVALVVDGARWWFSVGSVRRVGRDLFVHVDLQGPEVCVATIHLSGGVVLGVTARDMLTAACNWLLTRGAARHAFIDLAGQQEHWPASDMA